MGRDETIDRFRTAKGWRRATLAVAVLPAVAVLLKMVLSGAWEVAPFVVLLAAVGVAVGRWFGGSTGVTLTPEAIVIATPVRTVTASWSDVLAIEASWSQIWVQTVDGWYPLPVRATAVAEGGDATLADAVASAWSERRGADWSPSAPHPWNPDRDLEGRVVLRRPPERLVLMVVMSAALFGELLVIGPTDDLGAGLVMASISFFVLTAILVVYDRWARTTIDDDEVRVRSLLQRTSVARHSIVDVCEQVSPNGFRQLTIREVQPSRGHEVAPSFRTVALPVVQAPRWAEHNPAYYAIWAWLHEELIATDELPPVDGPADPVAPPTDQRS